MQTSMPINVPVLDSDEYEPHTRLNAHRTSPIAGDSQR